MPTEKEMAFHRAMLELCEIYRHEGLPCPIFQAMIGRHGGFKAAQLLLDKAEIQDGFSDAVANGKTNLTIEAMILDSDDWPGLFDETLLRTAYKRLVGVGYKPRWKPRPHK